MSALESLLERLVQRQVEFVIEAIGETRDKLTVIQLEAIRERIRSASWAGLLSLSRSA